MIDFATLVRPSSPNTYLVAPEGLCRAATPDRIAPIYPVAAERLRDAWLQLMRSYSRVRPGPGSGDPVAYTFVESTPLLGFKDDIDIRFIALGDGRSTLAVYSRSRVGYSDLGTNKKRVESWLEAVQAKL